MLQVIFFGTDQLGKILSSPLWNLSFPFRRNTILISIVNRVNEGKQRRPTVALLLGGVSLALHTVGKHMVGELIDA